MPDINSLLETSKKKFKKSSYRPWNYMEEIEKEEEEKSKDNNTVNDHKLVDHTPAPFREIKENNALVQDENLIISDFRKNSPNNAVVPETNKNHSSLIKNDHVKQRVSPLYSILRLSGHQKTIFTFILEKCLSNDSLSSGTVSGEHLTSITNTSLRMVNTSIQRLVEKKLLLRENGKRGRGGFYSFSITQEVKSSAIEHRKIMIVDNKELLRSTENQSETYFRPAIDNRQLINSVIPKDWEDIDIEPLQHIGFSKSHITQLYKQGELEAQSVQDSIYHFAFDLKYNNKSENITKSNPIGYFMGILKRSGVYTSPDNYESPKNMALRELLEGKRAEKEKYEAMIKELINIAFEEWQAELSVEEKDNIIPNEVKKHGLSGAKLASLKSYFMENVWSEKQKDYLIEAKVNFSPK